MRNEAEIKHLIIDKATTDDRIRAVLLNGSRANDKVSPDQYQDYDVVYIVTDLRSFVYNHSWVDYFGERLIMQMPTTMDLYEQDKIDDLSCFAYLMLFKDGNRIDLTLFPVDKIETSFTPGSLTKVWLDKDNLFNDLPPSNDSDYVIKPPGQKEFNDVCNEFWWVSTYVAKGLARNEITYAKEMLETVVRPMFMKMTAWYIGSKNNFTVPFGKAGKFMKRYLRKDYYNKILSTYTGCNINENWKALFTITELFALFAAAVANNLTLQYNHTEEANVLTYLKAVSANS